MSENNIPDIAKRSRMTRDEWFAEAKRRFGDDSNNWRFVCPSCGRVTSVQEWREAGASEGQIAFSCVGRALGSTKEIFDKTGGPCNYAGGGLFSLNPVTVEHEGQTINVFAFAESEGEQAK